MGEGSFKTLFSPSDVTVFHIIFVVYSGIRHWQVKGYTYLPMQIVHLPGYFMTNIALVVILLFRADMNTINQNNRCRLAITINNKWQTH